MQDKKLCSQCGQNISERQIALYRGLVSTLWRVYKWAKGKEIHEFQRKDIKHLFSNENDTARFGDLVMFGGLVYKHRKGVYGLNLERCSAFFQGTYKIPTIIWKNPVTKELRKEDYKNIKQIPDIMELLNEDGEYVAQYRTPPKETLF
jgi:hypothetical protein